MPSVVDEGRQFISEGHPAGLAAFRRALRTYQDPAPAGMEAAGLPDAPKIRTP